MKKKIKQNSDHMPQAADLSFLCLHVSQNTALYRKTVKRPHWSGSRPDFVFVYPPIERWSTIKILFFYSNIQLNGLVSSKHV